MYQPMLFIHWKQVQWVLLPFMLAAFGLPLLAVQGLGTPEGMESVAIEAYRVVGASQMWLPLFPLLAAAIGITLALSSWNWDHQLKHVYALSLPLSRWQYAMLKMGAGVALAMLPAGAFLIGAHVASASVSLPEGLHAYPNHLALRFFVAILISYSVLFAMAAGTVKTTVWVVSSIIAFVIIGNVATNLLGNSFELFERFSAVEWVFEAVVTAPGPFEVFTGNWSLIDV